MYSFGVFGCAGSNEAYIKELEKGLVYLNNQDYNKAILSFDKAINYNKYAYEPYYFRGIAKFWLSNYSNAINDFTLSLQYSTNDFGVYNYRAYAFMKLNEYNDAKKDIEHSLRINPQNFFGYYVLGDLDYKEGKYSDAIENLEYSFKLNSDVSNLLVQENLLLLGEIYLDYYNKSKEALYYLERLKNVIPDNCALNYYLGKANLKEDYILSKDYFTKVINICPDDEKCDEAYYNRGAICYANKDYALAIDDFTKAIELKSDDALSFKFRGYAYYQLGDFEKAISDFETAISLDSYMEGELREYINSKR